MSETHAKYDSALQSVAFTLDHSAFGLAARVLQLLRVSSLKEVGITIFFLLERYVLKCFGQVGCGIDLVMLLLGLCTGIIVASIKLNLARLVNLVFLHLVAGDAFTTDAAAGALIVDQLNQFRTARYLTLLHIYIYFLQINKILWYKYCFILHHQK